MRDPSSVAVLAYDGMSAFETGIVTEVFGIAWPEIDVPWYRLTICTETPEPVRMIGGATLQTPHGLDALAAAGTVVVPSVSDPEQAPSSQVVAALLYVDAGGVLTGGGCAAGLDLCTPLVRRAHGAGVATAAARGVVIPPH